MKIFTSIKDAVGKHGSIVSVGTFDGVHLGHQKILRRLKAEGMRNGWREVIITFEPHPQIVLKKTGKKALKLLTTRKEKEHIFEVIGIDNLVIHKFTEAFSKTKPEEFIESYLIKTLGMKKILVGYDHLFGKNREGNWELLVNLSKGLGFEIERIEAELVESNVTITEDELIVSSTKIRDALYKNNLELANKMLGYDYIIMGEVIKGDNRGIELGFPTANIKSDSDNKLLPGNGVYFVSSILDGLRYYGMANIGTRPTFTNNQKVIFEVHYFDYKGDLYGRKIIAELHKYIREEIKFNHSDELIRQMADDEEICREFIKDGINSYHDLKLKVLSR